MKLSTVFFIAISLITLAACGVESKIGGLVGAETDIKLIFAVDSNINPDEQGTPAPLFVRMYELKSTTLFEQADFIELYERDKSVLGVDLIGEPKILERLKPGEDREEVFVLDEQTRYVAFFAEFLQYENAAYKLILPITQNNVLKDKIKIQFSANKMQLLD